MKRRAMSTNCDQESVQVVVVDRKTVEKNRRNHMKCLCNHLTSLIPPNHVKPSKDVLSQQDQLEKAAAYIKQFKERVDKLKARATQQKSINDVFSKKMIETATLRSPEFPVFEVRDLGSSLEVVVISGLEKNFTLHEVISILEDEGTEVVNLSYSTLGDKVFHSIHAQVKVSRVGVETSKIYQKLQELIIC